jgi:hypothetical protein
VDFEELAETVGPAEVVGLGETFGLPLALLEAVRVGVGVGVGVALVLVRLGASSST